MQAQAVLCLFRSSVQQCYHPAAQPDSRCACCCANNCLAELLPLCHTTGPLGPGPKAKTHLLGVFGASCGKTWVYLKHPAADLVVFKHSSDHEANARGNIGTTDCEGIEVQTNIYYMIYIHSHTEVNRLYSRKSNKSGKATL